MLMKIYKKALVVVLKKPFKLWGISLLFVLLTSVLVSLCGVAIPALGIAVSMLLGTSMTMLFLAGYKGEEVEVTHLFTCFKDWPTMKRVVLGLSWMALWIFVWALIPIAGSIIALIRIYEYRLTPYILVTEPDVPITEAIKLSKERTKGYKLQMWLADFVYMLMFILVFVVLTLLSRIPYIGVLFGIVLFLVCVAFYALVPLFAGLVQAAFYVEIQTGHINCAHCGAKLASDAEFCSACGKPVKEATEEVPVTE